MPETRSNATAEDRQTAPERSEPDRIKLTATRIAALTVRPGERLRYIWDTQRTGLGVRVMATGAKSFVWYGKVFGKPRRITIASCSAISLEAARQQAQDIWEEVAAGQDPDEERRKRRAARYTLGQCLDDWVAHAKGRKKTADEDAALIRLHIPARLRSRPLNSITTPDVETLANSIAASGNARYAKRRTANKVLALLSSAIRRAVKHKLTESNPVSGAARFPKVERERFIRPDEMPRFLAALESQPQPWRSYFTLLLTTGARRSAVAGIRWQDLDLISAVWHLPAADSKSGKPITIPLSPVALRAIEAMRAHSEGHTHLFPGPGKKCHIVEPRKPWLRLCAAAKISDLRMHDVRRTLGSWLTAHGAPTALVMKALGHKSLQAAQVYQRLDVSSVRAAIEHVGEKMNLLPQ